MNENGFDVALWLGGMVFLYAYLDNSLLAAGMVAGGDVASYQLSQPFERQDSMFLCLAENQSSGVY